MTLADQVRDLLSSQHPVFDLVDRKTVRKLADAADATARRQLEQTLSLATWIDLYHPEIKLPR